MLARRPARISKPLRERFRQRGIVGKRKGHREGTSFPVAAAQGWNRPIVRGSGDHLSPRREIAWRNSTSQEAYIFRETSIKMIMRELRR